MALTEIEYGSLASSDVMNKNFEYLDNKISDVSENLASNVATINANIATANTLGFNGTFEKIFFCRSLALRLNHTPFRGVD